MIVKLLTEHNLEFLSLKGGCTGSSESTLVKVSNCWKSHAVAQLIFKYRLISALELLVSFITPHLNMPMIYNFKTVSDVL